MQEIVRKGLHFLVLPHEARMEDIDALRPILEIWIRFKGEIIKEEVDEVLASIKESIAGTNGRTYFVAEQNGEMVEMMGLLDPPKDKEEFVKTPRPIELVNAFVDKEWRRGRGVGGALVRHLESTARERGYTEMILDSGPRYQFSGWGFYDRSGFERAGVLKGYYDGFDARVWRKKL